MTCLVMWQLWRESFYFIAPMKGEKWSTLIWVFIYASKSHTWEANMSCVQELFIPVSRTPKSVVLNVVWNRNRTAGPQKADTTDDKWVLIDGNKEVILLRAAQWSEAVTSSEELVGRKGKRALKTSCFLAKRLHPDWKILLSIFLQSNWKFLLTLVGI